MERMGRDGKGWEGMEMGWKGDWKWEMRSGNVTYWYEGWVELDGVDVG